MSAREPQDDPDALRRASDRIERLLGELRGSTSAATWGRIEELVSSMTAIYGRGLEGMLDAFADGRGIDPRAKERLCDDPLVESLLLLHGLHPSPVEERVCRAMNRVRDAIGAGAGEMDVSPDASSGAVTIRLGGDWRRCPVPPAAIETALRRALAEAAPEIERVTVEKVGTFLPSKAASDELVQIDLSRTRRASPTPALG